jgi:hypothetical protein
MGHFFEFVLNVALDLQDLVRVVRVLDLLGDLARLSVHTGLEQALCVVKLV